MKKNEKEELLLVVENLQEEVIELIEENKQLVIKNEDLQDEVDSLWVMMDEITKSDIENFSHLLDEIKADVITRTLMVSKKKVDC
jgi:regulator of replication initiation timing